MTRAHVRIYADIPSLCSPDCFCYIQIYY